MLTELLFAWKVQFFRWQILKWVKCIGNLFLFSKKAIKITLKSLLWLNYYFFCDVELTLVLHTYHSWLQCVKCRYITRMIQHSVAMLTEVDIERSAKITSHLSPGALPEILNPMKIWDMGPLVNESSPFSPNQRHLCLSLWQQYRLTQLSVLKWSLPEVS